MLLLQTVGLLPRDLGVLRVTDAPIEKIPSGSELQRLFEETVVDSNELVSEAEKDWLYGDQAAHDRAALSDPGKRRPN